MKDIFQIRLGTSNVYIIRGEDGCVLVDAGNKGQAPKFKKRLKGIGLSPSDIKLIIITHVHFDHVGSLNELKELCKCQVAVHANEANLLSHGELVIPPGTNFFSKGVSWLASKLFEAPNRMEIVIPDVTFIDEMSLEEYGVRGKVIHTPGHTKGSVSVILSTGEAFVGDLAINYLPFGLGPIYPPFAENTKELLGSWKKLISDKANLIYPGHGDPFNITLLTNKLNSLAETHFA